MPKGTVKSFSHTSGYGFVGVNDKDYFLSARELNGQCVDKGTEITFQVTKTEKGEQATQVKVLGADKWYKGTVKSFNANKGFGFIECEARPGEDIFVSKQEIKGQWAGEKDFCKFQIEEGEKGPVAKGMELVGKAGLKQKDWHSGKGFGKGDNFMQQMMMQMMMGNGKGKGWW